jgi:hypothetical protein
LLTPMERILPLTIFPGKARRAPLRPAPTGWIALAAAAALAGGGCVSKKAAKLEAQQAFMAGQQQAVQRQADTFTVTVQGPVTNHILPWTIDLTLAKAIVEANYVNIFNPRVIRVVRNGQTTEVDPTDLLKGHDMPLEAGDVVQIVN